MEFLYLILGIIGLLISSNLVVRGAKNLANFFNVSELFIGLTVVALGTSLPEIAVNIMSGFNNLKGIEASGIAIGNIIGESLNLFTFGLGLIAIISTVIISRKFFNRDSVVLLVTVVIFFVMALDFRITRFEGITLILIYFIYLYFLHHHEKISPKKGGRKKPAHPFLDFSLLSGGLVLVLYSSSTVVKNGILVAESFGVPETLIAIFVISLGTSLPEVTVSLYSAIKKSYQLSIGNLMGSVTCDMLLTLGAGASIAGFNVEKKLVFFDIPFLFFTLVIALLLLRKGGRLLKWEGAILIFIYLIYLSLKFKFLVF